MRFSAEPAVALGQNKCFSPLILDRTKEIYQADRTAEYKADSTTEIQKAVAP